MAAGKSILKLVVDDKEYGSKLKNAQNALNALEAVLQGTGKSFAQVDKAVVDYAKSIGQMSAQATSARGKIGEMTSTFTELSLKYRQLTEEEKKSPFGQALSASLDQLRTRIQDNRQQLDDVTRSLSDTKQEGGATSGIMEQLAGLEDVSWRAMMGEYILYYRGKIVGGIYDDRFLVKPVKAAVDRMPEAELEVPYEGAKEMLLVDNVDDKEFLCSLLEAMYDELPEPKKKK